MSTMSIEAAPFKPISLGQPLAILMLIENSKSMLTYWPDLRDSYLPIVLGNIRAVNPNVPVCSSPLFYCTCITIDTVSIASYFTRT
jgi:hypothetical protein